MKNQFFVISIIMSLLMLAGCFDSGSDSAPANETDTRSNFNPADFSVTQLSALNAATEGQLQIQLNNLATDDAIYITVTSDEIDNSKLRVSPSKTILNPNKGSASLILTAKDLGLTQSPEIKVLVTTSGNSAMEQTKAIAWGN